MSVDDRFVRSPHVLERRTLDTSVLLAVDGDEPVVVAGTGSDVWALLMDPRTLTELVEVLAAHFTGEPGVIAHDVGELLETLVDARVVLRIPG